MSVLERLSARVAFMDSLGPDVKTVPESAGEDDRALLALVRAVEKADELFEMIVADLDPEDVAEIEQVRTALDAVRKVD
jgi:ABC-type histidine transport system ATPase subunit